MPDQMNLAEFNVRRRVEFCETDAAGIAHFSSFVCYMEQAEHRFLRHLDTSVLRELDDGYHLSWPRVHVECDYSGVARFEDELEIAVSVEALGTKSVTYGFRFHCDAEPIAQGKIVAVCCRMRPGQPLQSIEIPADLRSRFSTYVKP